MAKSKKQGKATQKTKGGKKTKQQKSNQEVIQRFEGSKTPKKKK